MDKKISLGINAKQVSYVRISDFMEGVYDSKNNSFSNYLFRKGMVYTGKKPPFIERLFGRKQKVTTIPDAFYKDGNEFNSYITLRDAEDYEHIIIKDGRLITKPFLNIYIGSESLAVLYFNSYEEALKYAKKRFSHLSFKFL